MTENIIYKYIRGSRLYGLNTESSDEDFCSIFVCPIEEILGFRNRYKQEIKIDGSDDNVAYEVQRWFELLTISNPNIIEGLFVPDDKIIIEPNNIIKILFDNKEQFLTKQLVTILCKYAHSQIAKSQGLNKKIVNPVLKKKTPLDFCYTIHNHGSISITKYLEESGLNEKYCGLVNIPNMRDIYALHYDPSGNYRGIIKEDSDDIRLSSVPKYSRPLCYISYNKDGFKTHCREYQEYQEWVKNRNPERYKLNMEHNSNFDLKNGMHCIRLLKMGQELVDNKGFRVDRTNIDRDYLLSIRNGKLNFNEFLDEANTIKNYIENNINKCNLPEKVDKDFLNDLLITIRLTSTNF